MHFNKRLLRDNRGISHVVLPLLLVIGAAVVGTFTMGASHANPAPKTAGANQSKSNTPKYGRLLIYSSGGTYDSVKIVPGNTDPSAPQCSGAKGAVVKNFKVTHATRAGGVSAVATHPPLDLRCNGINGAASYQVFFGNKHEFGKVYVAVDVDPGYCVFVHANPSQIRKVPMTKGNCGDKTRESDPTERVATVMQILPKIAANKHSIAGYAAISSPGQDLNRSQCTGQVTVAYHNATAKTDADVAYNAPLKFVHNKKVANDYCVAVLNTNLVGHKVLPAGTWNITANFPGTPYLAPAAATGSLALK